MGAKISQDWKDFWAEVKPILKDIYCLAQFWNKDTCGLDWGWPENKFIPLFKFVVFMCLLTVTLALVVIIGGALMELSGIIGDVEGLIGDIGSIVTILESIAQFFVEGVYYLGFAWYFMVETFFSVFDRIQNATQASPFLMWATPVLLLVWSLLETAILLYGLEVDFQKSLLGKVFHYLDYPMRLLHDDVLVKHLGKLLGNVIYMIFVPFDIMILILSVVPAFIWWLWDQFQNNGAPKSKYYL